MKSLQGQSRGALVRTAFRLEWLTLAWMLIETSVALWSGLAAKSLTLIAFGADSAIELASACVLLWRLAAELRHGKVFSETAERRATTIGAVLLFVLALYVTVLALWGLFYHRGQMFSLTGTLVTATAIPLMYGLARAKLNIADQIGSCALRTDAAESFTCLYLSAVVLIGLVMQLLLNAWWIDSAAALILVPLLSRESVEAWRG
jgi:divalent metal cation (Fe/Co/Zn/Cd) transporter